MPTVNDLVRLSQASFQTYFDNRTQLAQVIEWVSSQIGCANVVISTFSTSEEFIRRLWRLKESGKIESCTMFCDLRAARKTLSLYSFMKNVFDKVALCQNHSKVVLLYNDSCRVSIVTSQNQTRGDRFECGIISTDESIFNNLSKGFDALEINSLPLEHLLSDRPDS